MLRLQSPLTTRKENGLREISVFVVQVYLRAWLTTIVISTIVGRKPGSLHCDHNLKVVSLLVFVYDVVVLHAMSMALPKIFIFSILFFVLASFYGQCSVVSSYSYTISNSAGISRGKVFWSLIHFDHDHNLFIKIALSHYPIHHYCPTIPLQPPVI